MPDDPRSMLHVSPALGSAAFEAPYDSGAVVNVTVRLPVTPGAQPSAEELVTRQYRALEAARHDLLRAAKAREIKVLP